MLQRTLLSNGVGYIVLSLSACQPMKSQLTTTGPNTLFEVQGNGPPCRWGLICKCKLDSTMPAVPVLLATQCGGIGVFVEKQHAPHCSPATNPPCLYVVQFLPSTTQRRVDCTTYIVVPIRRGGIGGILFSGRDNYRPLLQ